MSPRLAVAENFAQLEALFSHSRLSRRKTSLVVPKCIRPLDITVALCVMEFRAISCQQRVKIHVYMVLNKDLHLFFSYEVPIFVHGAAYMYVPFLVL